MHWRKVLRPPVFARRTYAVLANLSAGYSPPLGTFRSVTPPFAARQHLLLHLLPLDLHVLGTPPAFNLSQDQTLHLKISRIIRKRVDPKWLQLTAGHFGHSVFAPKAQDASPHTNYLPNF